MRSTTLKICLILLVLLSSSFALSLDDFKLVLPFTIVIMVIMLAATYMLSQALQNSQLSAWVKTEIREMIVAAILVVIVIGIMASNPAVNGIINTLTGTSGQDYKVQANGVLDGMIAKANSAYLDDMKAFHLIGLMSGFSTSLAIAIIYFGGYFGSSPYMGFSAFFVFLSQAASGLSGMIFLYTALKVLMDFFLKTSGSLVYIAFAFRFIPFTRQLGNTLIGFFVGVYVILPLSILLVGGMHSALGSGMPSPHITKWNDMEIDIPYGASFICSKDAGTAIRFILGFFGEIGFALPPCIAVAILSFGYGFWPCMWLMTSIVYPLVVLGVTIAWDTIMAAYSWHSDQALIDNATAIFHVLQPYMQAVNNLVVLSYVDAIVIMAITYIGAKAISTALGGEYLVPGVQRLVG